MALLADGITMQQTQAEKAQVRQGGRHYIWG